MKNIRSVWNTFVKFRSKLIFFAFGLASLTWFLIRVIPKPSRAFYPCQRAAFPFASSFIIWLTSNVISLVVLKKAKEKLVSFRYLPGVILISVAVLSFTLSWFLVPSQESYSRTPQFIAAEEAPPVIKRSEIIDNMAFPLAKVAIARSDKDQASDLSAGEIEDLIREAVEKDGVLDTLIKDGQTVVIKPNLVSNLEYSANSTHRLPVTSNGVITDWRVIRAIVNIVRDYNPSGNVYVLEGSADGGTTREIMSQYGYSHENIPGVNEFIYLEEASGSWEDWNSELLSKVTLPADKALYPNNLKPNNSDTYYLNKIYYEADVLISVPLLKNHIYTFITGAVKNVGIGATPQRIYAAENDNHRYTGNRIDHLNFTNLHKFIHDYYLCRLVDYVIMEALVGTEYGPVAEHPVNYESCKKNMRMILAGKDAVAVDAIASLLMGYDPTKVNHLVYLHNDTAGCVDPAAIRILGPEIHPLKKSFTHYSNLSAKNEDFIPPDAEITNYSFDENSMNIILSDISDISKVEIEINGELTEKDILSGFDNIHIEFEEEITPETSISIKIYDALLNCKSFHFQNGELLASYNIFSDDELKMYPNPVEARLSLCFNNDYAGAITMNVLNNEGKTLSSEKFEKTSGRFVYNADLSSLDNGNYIVQLTNQNATLAKAICKF